MAIIVAGRPHEILFAVAPCYFNTPLMSSLIADWKVK